MFNRFSLCAIIKIFRAESKKKSILRGESLLEYEACITTSLETELSPHESNCLRDVIVHFVTSDEKLNFSVLVVSLS